MNIVTIIQARMSSTRLPGKVLKETNGKPLLWYVRNRCEESSKVDQIIIATSSDKSDDIIETYCQKNNWNYFRGDLKNVLKRYYDTALKTKAEVIVRVTGDCPLIDASLIDEAIDVYKNSNVDYVSNTVTRTYPRGFDLEVFSFEALKYAYEHAQSEEDKEHVTPFIWKNNNGRFKIAQLTGKNDFSRYRITVDTPEDFEVLKILIEHYNAANLRYNEIIDILTARPEIAERNNHIEQKKV